MKINADVAIQELQEQMQIVALRAAQYRGALAISEEECAKLRARITELEKPKE